MDNYDLIVIGAGAAGSGCAEKANNNGLRVALIERDAVGGTCLNYGCDPTKTALHSAKVLFRARHAADYGLDIPEAAVDWPALQRHIRDVQETLRGGTEREARENMRQRGIDLIIGTAVFASPHEVRVGGRVLRGDNIVIATGTEPAVPDIPGLAGSDYLTNINIFDMDYLPETMAVMGGGPIGVEYAQLFARLGTAVHLFELAPQILPRDDPALAAELAGILGREGLEIHTQARITAVAAGEEGKRLTIAYESGYEEMLVFDALLVAAGRQRAAAGLELDKAGLELQDGRIQTDDTLRTSVPHIWSAGDVSSDWPFTHIAWRQGAHVAKNIIAGKARPFAYEPVPWVTYTDPELAHVGRTEAELEAAGVSYRVLETPLEQMARAVATGQRHGRVKLLVGDDGLILGGHILAANGGELLGPILLAMEAGIPISAVGRTVWPYPTMSEVLGKTANIRV